MEIERKIEIGDYGWIGLVGYVLLVDGAAWRRKHQTMSMSFGRVIQSKRGRRLCLAGWALLTAHLWWSVPLPGQQILKRIVVDA